MKIEILKSAQQDLTNGAKFYESLDSGLGSYFLDTLFSDIDSLNIYAGHHQIYYQQYFRALSKRFPFAIYYQKHEDVIKVFAVLDTRRKPAWIRNKFK